MSSSSSSSSSSIILYLPSKHFCISPHQSNTLLVWYDVFSFYSSTRQTLLFETFISLFYDVTEMFSLSKFVWMFIFTSCVARADRSVNVLAPSAPAAGVLEVTVMAARQLLGSQTDILESTASSGLLQVKS